MASTGRWIGTVDARAAAAAHVGFAVQVAQRSTVARFALLALCASKAFNTVTRVLRSVVHAVVETQFVAHTGKQLLRVGSRDWTQTLGFAFVVIVRWLADTVTATAHSAVFLGTLVLARRTDVSTITQAEKPVGCKIQHAAATVAAPAGALKFAVLATVALVAGTASGDGAAAHAAVVARAHATALQLIVGAQRVGRRERGTAALAPAGGLARAGAVARGVVVAVPTAAPGGAHVIRRTARRQAPAGGVVAVAVFAMLAAQHVGAGAPGHAVDLGACAAVQARARGAPATRVRWRAIARGKQEANVAVAVARHLFGELVQRDVTRAEP